MELIDTNRVYMPGTGQRFIRLGIAREGMRDYWCFVDKLTQQFYIEEMGPSGRLEFISDDSLAQELNDFFVYHKVLLMDRPLIPNNQWFKMRPEVKND